MLSPHNKPLPTRSQFLRQLLRTMSVAFLIVCSSLFIGIIGYHEIENFTWIDAYFEAALIASGMGPSIPLKTTAGKLFAGTYALYSGFALIAAVGMIVAPLIHRFFHRFHLEGQKK